MSAVNYVLTAAIWEVFWCQLQVDGSIERVDIELDSKYAIVFNIKNLRF